MTDKRDNTRRLAKNTALLYVRSLFSLFVSLYSSRLVLQALGVDDYGLYNAVAGFASMFWLVTGSISSAISRFLTFELGKEDHRRLSDVFSMSLNLMLGFAVIVFLLAETGGMWFVANKMTIPPGREAATLLAFQTAVFTVMSGMILAPFNSSVIAHEKMGLYALTGILEVVLKLAIALFLVYGAVGDTLKIYSILWMCSVFLSQGIVVVYCLRHFTECRFRLFFEKKLFKEMFAYAGWSFIGSSASTLNSQGVNVAINIFLGPAVNAARGLTNTVSNAVSIFVNNFTTALVPQITKSYAAGEKEYTKSLAFRGTKFSYYIMLLISIPLILETEFVLNVWLTEVPEHTVAFIRLIQILNLTNLLYYVFFNVQNASGRNRTYQLWMSVMSLVNFALAVLLLKLGLPPESLYVLTILISYVRCLIFLRILKGTMPFTLREIFKEVYAPIIIVSITSAVIPACIYFCMPYGWIRFLTVGFTSVATTSAAVLLLGCKKGERELLINMITEKFRAVKTRE